jgi:ribosomal protein S18 acetylase RimI-like enzyme
MYAWQGTIRPVNDADREWVDRFVRDYWGGPTIISDKHEHRPAELDGFLAMDHNERAGLITLFVEGDGCEVVTLNNLRPRTGAGTALLNAAVDYARVHGCSCLWLTTTNDNTHALRFYQRFGMRIAAVRCGVIDEQRRRKPTIPLTGNDGIPIRDEIELVLDLAG